MRYGNRGTHRTTGRRCALAVAVATIALAGCGHPTGAPPAARRATSTTPPSPAARGTVAHLAPPGVAGGGERLAVALPGRGMAIWTPTHGTVVIARTRPQVDWFSDPTWSADGRYLAWLEGPAGAGPTMGLVRYDTRRGTSTAWTLSTDFIGAPTVVTADGVFLLDADAPARTAIREYLPAGTVEERAVTGPAAAEWTSFGFGGGMAATATGFVTEGAAGRAGPSGAATISFVAVDGSSRTDALLRQPSRAIGYLVASPSGDEATLVGPALTSPPMSDCGVALHLEIVDLRTGAMRYVPVPDVRAGGAGRIAGIGYGPSGILDLVDLPCRDVRSGAVAPVVLEELHGGALVPVAGAALQGMRSATGALAVIPARYMIETSGRMATPFAVGSQSGPVTVDGRPLPSTGPAAGIDPGIAWAPAA